MPAMPSSTYTGMAESMSEEREDVVCPVCGYSMEYLQACHVRCPNCGAELDCDDKGIIW